MSYGHDFTHHCVCFICMTVLYYLCSIDGKTSVFKSTTVKFYHGMRLSNYLYTFSLERHLIGMTTYFPRFELFVQFC